MITNLIIMKTFILLLAISTMLCNNVLGNSPLKSTDEGDNPFACQSVPLRKVKGNNSDILRSTTFLFAQAYISGKVLTVDFSCPIESAVITVINDDTGAIVYSETYSSPSAATISLENATVGNYQVEIDAFEECLYGEFRL